MRGGAVSSVIWQEAGKQSGGQSRDVSMHTIYWSVVHEAQKQLKRKFPDMPAKEILKKAKQELSGLNGFYCLYRSNNFEAM